MTRSGPSILVIGSINADLVARVDRLPKPGETILAEHVASVSGGKGANQAVAAARLGASVRMLGRVGDDVFGRQLISGLLDAGICTEYVATLPHVSSGVAMIQVDAQGENVITVASGANALLTPNDVFAAEELFESADMLMVQPEIPIDTVVAAVEMAERHGVPVILDPAPAPRTPLPLPLAKLCVLTPNQSEAAAISGMNVDDLASAKSAAAELLQRGAPCVVLKLGRTGALLATSPEAMQHIGAPEVEAVDTTAAGDAFTAAMAVELASGAPLEDAVRFACAAGAVAVTKLGAQPAMPTRAAVDELRERNS